MSNNATILRVKIDEAKGLLATINEEGVRERYDALKAEIKNLNDAVKDEAELKGIEDFLVEPAAAPKAVEPATVTSRDPFVKSLGEVFTESEAYKAAVKGYEKTQMPAGRANLGFEAKGFLFPSQQKATFTTTGTGLDSSMNYVTPPGGMVMVEQQRLTIRDLLSVGETTQNSIKYIKETSFTNAADMVAEEGEKPEATLLTEDQSADVKKIAVVLKVTDEMYSDFPMLRDYINTRLRFMVLAKEEQQLLNGTGSGNQITGILQTSGIQTQAKGGDSNFIALHKAVTKIRAVGFYEPDGLVIHPTDWQLLRIAVDGNTQFYGGGPFTDQYGSGPYPQNPMVWGLRPVVTTAISAGTALVGAFKLGAQIWQREGVRVDSTNSNEDDFNFNRITLRVEERLALAVYRPLAFCTVTSIA